MQLLAGYGRCAVAFSGGVDSAVVAKAAQVALGDAAVAVTGTSDALAAGELEAARDLAAQIGIRHVVISTEEFANPDYVANKADRCYHCKTELYSQLGRMRERLGVDVVVNGANADDLGDYRPGMQAADEHDVRSPLAECGLTKQEVRQLAASWELPVADKPATPCLSSRVAYGLQRDARAAGPDRSCRAVFAFAWASANCACDFMPTTWRALKCRSSEVGQLVRAEDTRVSRRGVRAARLQVRHARSGRLPLGRLHEARAERDADAVFVTLRHNCVR